MAKEDIAANMCELFMAASDIMPPFPMPTSDCSSDDTHDAEQLAQHIRAMDRHKMMAGFSLNIIVEFQSFAFAARASTMSPAWSCTELAFARAVVLAAKAVLPARAHNLVTKHMGMARLGWGHMASAAQHQRNLPQMIEDAGSVLDKLRFLETAPAVLDVDKGDCLCPAAVEFFTSSLPDGCAAWVRELTAVTTSLCAAAGPHRHGGDLQAQNAHGGSGAAGAMSPTQRMQQCTAMTNKVSNYFAEACLAAAGPPSSIPAHGP